MKHLNLTKNLKLKKIKNKYNNLVGLVYKKNPKKILKLKEAA